MTRSHRVSTTDELLNFLKLTVLPRGVEGLMSVTGKLAENHVEVEGEALETLGLAFQGILGSGDTALEQINEKLEARLKRLDEAHAERLIKLISEVAAFDLSSSDKAELYRELIHAWHEQSKQDKRTFGDLAKIGAVVVGVIAVIGARAIGVKYARPKTFADVAYEIFRAMRG